jgi:hypothetical protein
MKQHTSTTQTSATSPDIPSLQNQRLTLVHFSSQRKRFVCDRGAFKGCLGGVKACLGVTGSVQGEFLCQKRLKLS